MASMRRGQGKTKKELFGRDGRNGKGDSTMKQLLREMGGGSQGIRLSHRAYEIIPRNSPYGHHFRTLLNAENFVSQREYQMALDIYQRLLNKIPIRSSRDKIEENIHDIQSFMETHDDSASPTVHLDVRFSGPVPGSTPPADTGAGPSPGQGGQAGGQMAGGQGPSVPFQIQITPHSGPLPPEPAAPQPEQPGVESPAMPFGFFAQQTEDPEAAASAREAKKRADEGDFFEQEKEALTRQDTLEMLEGSKEANKHLRDISDSVFNIERAIFDTSNMKVESGETSGLTGQETSDTTPEGRPEGGGAEAAAGEAVSGRTDETTGAGEKGEQAGEEATQEGEQAAEPGSEERAAEGGEEVGDELGEKGAERTDEGAAEEAEEEFIAEEKPEGVLESQDAIPALDTTGEVPVEEGEEKPPEVQEIRGVLELREPEQEDTPFITITYDFAKIPHHFSLSKDHNILEYAYYKYKPMLMKAQKFIKKKQITKALNYYRVIRDQQIPDTLRVMVDRNIQDISEYLEKYLMSRPV